jgi:3-dehydroquinate dehydratase-2
VPVLENTMTRLLLIQGANLVWLGKREPEIYGRTSAAELDAMLAEEAKRRSVTLDIRYTNLEGEAIDWIYEAAGKGIDGLLMNPAGFTYSGYALRDCLKGVRDSLPYVEVHISNIDARGIKSATGEAARGVIQGFGLDGYFVGLDAMLRLLAKKDKPRG